MSDDLYKDLGVSPDATTAEIEAAAKRRFKVTHPDAGGDREQFESACRALTILRDPARREKYDATGDANDDPEDMATAQAMTTITGKLMAIIQNPHTDLARVNVVHGVRTMIQTDRAQAQHNIRETEAMVARLNKGKARLKRKGGAANALTPAIDAVIRNYQSGIAQARRQERMLDAALELLDGYEYEVDQAPTYPTGGGNYDASLQKALNQLFRG